MLVSFTVENFRSYRDPKTINLVADTTDDLLGNIIEVSDDLSLVRTAAVYGGNASGKSNLLYAMNTLSEMLEAPTNRPLRDRDLQIDPFALDRYSSQKPSRFGVRFIVEKVLCQYSVAIGKERIEEERFSAWPHGREQEWFRRVGDDIELNKTHLKGPKQPLREMTAPNGLFLAVAAAFNHPQLTQPALWLANNLVDRLDVSSNGPMWLREQTARRLRDDPTFMSWANAFMRKADFGIDSIGVDTQIVEVRRRTPSRTNQKTLFPSEIRAEKEERAVPHFVHTGSDGVTAKFVLNQESLGTRRLFMMLGPLYDVLVKGNLAVIDELSASMHPGMVRELIRLFHNPSTNPNDAQLVFATHDTTLLSGQLFRRDQVWFTEKAKDGVSDLYSLSDIKGVRPEEPFDKNYLRGKYGAIPFFGEFDFPETKETLEARDETSEAGEENPKGPASS